MKEIRAVGGARIIVDDDLYESLVVFRWHYEVGVRVYRHQRHRRISLPKSLLKLNPITHRYHMIKYRDGNVLNNQRDNLEVLTRSAHMQRKKKKVGASSKYRGVIYAGNESTKRKKKWKAVTFINNVSTYIGHFYTEDMAAVAYNLFVLKHIGKHALLNNVIGMERYYEQNDTK